MLRFYRPLCFSDALRGPHTFCFTILRTALLILRPSLAPFFFALRFTDLSTQLTVSDGHIFRCTTKDMEERRAKGLRSRPLETAFIRGKDAGRALVVRVRNGAYNAIKSASALRLSPCLGVLRCSGNFGHFRNHPTSDYTPRWLFYKCYECAAVPCSTIESGGSSACNRAACCMKEAFAFCEAIKS